ncbi:acetyl-CoA carboxylase biotin carboxyl carrier protein subunit [Mobilicoccus caccae]|nr:acetyl-CoA carboxylase biotin carboxyl carrier protein subunit [Mobilicoccus caccae]
MSGVVAEISVAPGDVVEGGQVVAVMEAMKLKSPIVVDTPGTIATVEVSPGDAVASGATILTLS